MVLTKEAALGEALFGAFERIRVINLASRPDRLADIRVEFKRIGVSFDDARIARFDASRPADAGPFPSRGARGCFLSHLGVLREAEAEGARALMILEDDAGFVRGIDRALAAVLARLASERWDVFYGFVGADARERTEALGDGLRVLPSDVGMRCSHWVCLRGETIARLREHLETMLAREPGDPAGGPMHVDGAYSHFRRAHPELRTIVADPSLGLQRQSRTDIHDLAWFDRFPLLRESADGMRRLRRRLARS